jgi:hypothetical protein
MTTTKTIQSEPIGLSHISCIPLWDYEKNEIILFDMYLKDTIGLKGTWIGSKRLLKYCEEVNDNVRRNGSD